jgi:hypothetical protein
MFLFSAASFYSSEREGGGRGRGNEGEMEGIGGERETLGRELEKATLIEN